MASAKHIYLVEPDIPTRYLNPALMKLSTKHKLQGDTVQYIKGFPAPLHSSQPDIIYISTLFTYYAKQTVQCIRYYQEHFPNADIQVGGIFATLMPEYLEKETGIKPFVGYCRELDRMKPDYSLFPEFVKYTPKIKRFAEYSILSTTRGCPRSCGFCVVNRLEPECHIIDGWEHAIDLKRRYAIFLDSNLTAFPFDHFKHVMEFIIRHKRTAFFNGGFDVRLLNDDHINLLAQCRWATNGLRLAFDHMGEDGYVQRAIEKLFKKGVYKTKLMVFCLFNYHDTFEEAFYRCSEVYRLGARPFPQAYHPLDQLVKKDYVSEHWTRDLISKFSDYWFKASHFKSKTWEQYLAECEARRTSSLAKKANRWLCASSAEKGNGSIV
jgi:hypothetical protein